MNPGQKEPESCGLRLRRVNTLRKGETEAEILRVEAVQRDTTLGQTVSQVSDVIGFEQSAPREFAADGRTPGVQRTPDARNVPVSTEVPRPPILQGGIQGGKDSARVSGHPIRPVEGRCHTAVGTDGRK